MKYTSNYLTDVLVRSDFLNFINFTDNKLDTSVLDLCLSLFPHHEIRTITSGKDKYYLSLPNKLVFDVPESEELQEWHFFSDKFDAELVLSQKFILCRTKNYINFEDFINPFMKIITAFNVCYNKPMYYRLGLRYIYQIDLSDINNKSTSWAAFWNKYIAHELIGPLYFIKNNNYDSKLTRQMSTLVLNYNEFMIRFLFGIHNEGFPSRLKRQKFILDTDVFCDTLPKFTDFNGLLYKFMLEANALFEKSIKQPLRLKMGVVDNE
ncbi:MAG: TIGR04255 family protein [Deltaproteobacteria bacterium]|jgi:uncharacterized protein (TIGR04255 family)|nr:TIGR04255 family protein [Deltaproteobacteria bacterium]